jgi:hypothetical protein
MKFVFEDNSTASNFISCTDVNQSGIKRFTPSPMVITLFSFGSGWERYDISNKPKKYIISTGVNHHPNDWTGYLSSTRKSCFEFLNETYLKDLRKGRALLLFDQSFEGYQTTWLWKFFHDECEKFNINPRAIVYVTGNLIANTQYRKWAEKNNITDYMSIIPYSHFEKDVYMMSTSVKTPVTIDQTIEYKKNNLEQIKIYNCLQKRLRNHRIWFYTELFKADLIKDGLVSMNRFDNYYVRIEKKEIDKNLVNDSNQILPLRIYGRDNNVESDNFYIRRILSQVYLDTWVSVISEASFADEEHTVFISEKTYKSIANFHPFIILGNKGSLKKLRQMGYKTFDGFIDESYDTLSTFDRFNAIIESIEKIKKIENKMEWYMSMKDILIHNYEVLKKNSKRQNTAFQELHRYNTLYFRKNDV